MKLPMSLPVRCLILGASFLLGCRTAHNVAVTSFRVIDAPANYVRRHIDDEQGTTGATTTTSDVTNPGQPVAQTTPPPPSTTPRRSVAENEPTAPTETEPPASTPRPSVAAPSSKIPFAKPVPGKPGYVYSPFDPNGGYVDVTGYASGSKAKDPYSGKIFIVP